MLSKYTFVFLFSTLFWSHALAQKKIEKQLLYCREDLELTEIYPLSKSTYLALDWGEFKIGDKTRRARSVLLRLIGEDGFSKDSLLFRGSIKEVIPIGAKTAIANSYSFSYVIDIVNDKLVKRDSAMNLRELKWLLTDEPKTALKGRSLKAFKKSAKKDLKKLRGINELGVYEGWAIFSKENKSGKARDKQLLYSVVNTKTKEVIRINQLEDIIKSNWRELHLKFDYWRRTVFFIDDTIYFSHPDTGKCYLFNVTTQKISFFSFPEADKGLWFFTYDYVKKKKYLVKHQKGTFDLYFFSGPDEKLTHLMQTKEFDNYVFNDAILLPQKEKGNQGKVVCFYILPVYENLREWD